eukprot:TRINITY_DN7486_c0_g1_i1.p1 TRINITY_DN7486_c0_g1~~TRINITY_DN7486_c0_g1_i1.p1  ORF type:complete len:507 (+),score=87.33 TRINITY_DN7486_c0_g1_i1:601-2121(+)
MFQTQNPTVTLLVVFPNKETVEVQAGGREEMATVRERAAQSVGLNPQTISLTFEGEVVCAGDDTSRLVGDLPFEDGSQLNVELDKKEITLQHLAARGWAGKGMEAVAKALRMSRFSTSQQGDPEFCEIVNWMLEAGLADAKEIEVIFSEAMNVRFLGVAEVLLMSSIGVSQMALLKSFARHPSMIPRLASFVDVGHKDCNGNTALHLSMCSVQACTTLLEKGADPNARNSIGAAPLHLVCLSKKYDWVPLLLRYGADINAADAEGNTVLHLCRSVGDCTFFLEKGADPNAKDKRGNTPLHLSCEIGAHVMLVPLLVQNGADVNSRNLNGETPLHKCRENHKQEECVRVLLHHGADPTLRDELGGTVLHASCLKEKVISLLIDQGVDVNAKDAKGETPLFHAGSKNAFSLLLEKGADPKVLTAEGRSLLHCVCQRDLEWHVRTLLQRGADVGARDAQGETPLHRARSKKVAECLIEYGADRDARNNSGELAEILAEGVNEHGLICFR